MLIYFPYHKLVFIPVEASLGKLASLTDIKTKGRTESGDSKKKHHIKYGVIVLQNQRDHLAGDGTEI